MRVKCIKQWTFYKRDLTSIKIEPDDRGTRLGREYFRTKKSAIGGSGKYWKE